MDEYYFPSSSPALPDDFKEPEPIVPFPTQRDRDWHRVHKDAITFPRARSKKGTTGPRSLVAMCLRGLADNIRAVSSEMIDALPSDLKWRLWKELLPRNMSLHAWAKLSKSLREETRRRYRERKALGLETTLPMAIYRYNQDILNPPCELDTYTAPLSQLDHGCLTYLCIANIKHFETHELLALARLPRLAVLEVNALDSSAEVLSDRLVRGWGEVDGGFSSLRVLKITSNAHTVSQASLQYVLQFRMLEIFDVTAFRWSRWCRAEAIAAEQGWKTSVPRKGDSAFTSYAKAYLDGFLMVETTSVGALQPVFENDRWKVGFVEDTRRRAADEQHVSPRPSNIAIDGEISRNRTRLEEDWRALLEGEHSYSSFAEVRLQAELSDNDVFWFLALLDQKECTADGIAECADGITLPNQRVVSLRLRNPSNRSAAEQDWRVQGLGRIIFSRTSEPQETEVSEAEGKTATSVPARQPQRLEERRTTGLQARKRQKLGDVFSSMGVL
ncbi:hypothetical protein VTI74DRAFT_9635 [Chaetomium olivicolor]